MFKRNKELVKVASSKPARMFTTFAVVGVAATIMLTQSSTTKADKRLKDIEKTDATAEERMMETWRIYLPAAVAASLTVFCILRASKLSTIRSEAILTAFIIEPFIAKPAAE